MLKPGGLFSGYEWLSTPAYNPSNAQHRAIMADIELGNGLPDVRSIEQVRGEGEGAGGAGAPMWLGKGRAGGGPGCAPPPPACRGTLAASRGCAAGAAARLRPLTAALLPAFPPTPAQCKQALIAAGFEILEAEDLALTADIPWCAARAAAGGDCWG